MPDTLRSATGGGGRYLFYHHPLGFVIPGVRGWMPGIDIKSDGGYVILPEGLHKSGVPYRWLNWEVQAPTELPADIAKMILDRPAVSSGGYTSAGGFDIACVLSGLPQGERNDAIFKFCCWLRRQYHDDWHFVLANADMANARCVPPMSQQEVRQCVESAFKQDHDTVRSNALLWTQTINTSGGWDDPLPLVTNDNLPAFPIEALPPVLANMALAVTEANQVPVDLPAIMGLAALSASLVGRVKLCLNRSWSETINVFALGLIDSGNRKSPTVKAMTGPLFDLQYQLQQQARPAINAAKARKKALEDVAKAAANALRKHPENQEDIQRAEQANFAATTFTVPELPLLIVSDATPEALGLRLAEQAERLAVFDAEGGGLITMMGGQYGNRPNLDLLLKSHDGDPTTIVRVKNQEPQALVAPQLTIGMLTQPELLRQVIGVEGAFDRGLVARFMISAPPDPLGQRKSRAAPVPMEVQSAYAALLSSFVNALWALVQPHEMTIEPDAVEMLLDFQDKIEPRLAKDGDLRPLGGFAGKIVGSAARFGALHHLGWYGPVGLTLPINGGSAARGIKLARYAIEHYRYVMAATGFVTEIAIAERIVRWRQRDQRSEFTRGQAQRDLRISRVEEMEGPLRLLEDNGYVKSVGVQHQARTGRKPSDTFLVNPAVWQPGSVNSVGRAA
jgi:replicative DNA helicase